MADSPDLMPLSAATVQQIQFELFRRSAVSVEYGDRVEPLLDVLRTHPNLWTGMVIDRIHIGHRGHGLLPMTRIPLRDIGQKYWNADTLYLLCPTRAAADGLAALMPMEEFGCMVAVYDDPDQLGSSPGRGRRRRGHPPCLVGSIHPCPHPRDVRLRVAQ